MSGPVDYKALYELYEEAERRRQEAERGRQEAERGRQEAERALMISRLETEQSRQREQDANALVVSQQRVIQEIQQSQANQGIHPYLALISRLHMYVGRLLPLETAQITEATEPTPTTNPSATTGGRTSIHNKFYPLKLRVWSAFPELHKSTFARILEADRGSLPSRQTVQVQEETILQRLPAEGAQIEYFLDETRTAQYVDVAWETPAWHVLRQYLAASNARHQIRFLSNLGARRTDSAVPSSSASVASSAAGSSSDSTSSASSGTSKTPAAALKAHPDCVVLAYAEQEPKRRVVLGEYKPCHALPSAKAAAIVEATLPEAYMIRLAREARTRRARRQRTQAAQLAQQQRADSVDPEDAEWMDLERHAPGALPRQVYFAYAITQVYHYMLVSGTAFGYVATGETMTALHIPDDDPTCLLYHTSVFPAPVLPDAVVDPGLVTATPPLIATDPADVDALLALPAAQLSSLCVMAYEADTTKRDTLWTTAVLERLSVFPRKPKSEATTQRAESPSSLGRRQRDDDDNDNSDGGNSRRRTLQPPNSGFASGSQVRTPSPLQLVSSSTEGHSARQPDQYLGAGSRVRKPTLPYCTQACLRGLVQDGPLDPRCPNVASHRLGPSQRGPGVASDAHRITADQLRELVRAQLRRAPEFDAECLYGAGLGGAIGHLFKITATEYGYTLMAKAVQWQHRRRLRHEERVYSRLQKHQGVLVPVCLGGFELAAPLPLLDYYRAVTHMLLLSYGGVSVLRAQARQEQQAMARQASLQEQSPPPSEIDDQVADGEKMADVPVPLPWGDVDIDAATQRTMRALWAAGFVDEDDNAANVLWCAETGRVMKIDFDKAHVYPPGDAQDAPTEARKRAQDEPETRHHGLRDGKRVKHEETSEEVV